MGAFTTVTSKGQMTIPKEVRDELLLTPGTRLFVTIQDGKLVAKPKNKKIADLAGVLQHVAKGMTSSLQDYDNAIGEALAEDDDRIRREWNEDRKGI